MREPPRLWRHPSRPDGSPAGIPPARPSTDSKRRGGGRSLVTATGHRRGIAAGGVRQCAVTGGRGVVADVVHLALSAAQAYRPPLTLPEEVATQRPMNPPSRCCRRTPSASPLRREPQGDRQRPDMTHVTRIAGHRSSPRDLRRAIAPTLAPTLPSLPETKPDLPPNKWNLARGMEG